MSSLRYSYHMAQDQRFVTRLFIYGVFGSLSAVLTILVFGLLQGSPPPATYSLDEKYFAVVIDEKGGFAEIVDRDSVLDVSEESLRQEISRDFMQPTSVSISRVSSIFTFGISDVDSLQVSQSAKELASNLAVFSKDFNLKLKQNSLPFEIRFVDVGSGLKADPYPSDLPSRISSPRNYLIALIIGFTGGIFVLAIRLLDDWTKHRAAGSMSQLSKEQSTKVDRDRN